MRYFVVREGCAVCNRAPFSASVGAVCNRAPQKARLQSATTETGVRAANRAPTETALVRDANARQRSLVGAILLFILMNAMPLTVDALEMPAPADLHLVAEKLLLEAIATAQQAVRDAPDDAEAWGKLGHVYLVHGWEEPSIPCYRRASRLAPDEFRWHYFLGRMTMQREPQTAVQAFTRALQLDATSVPVHLYLATALRVLGQLDAAKHHLARAKELQPDNPFSELWLGEIALASQQVARAETHLKRALRINPRQREAHALMAQVQLALGDTAAAKRHAEAARQPNPFTQLREPLWWEVLRAGVTAPLYAERGRRYLSEGDFASAAAEFEPLISHKQKEVAVWRDYGIALLHTERYNEAIAAFESAHVLLRSETDKSQAEITDLTAEIHYYLGRVYAQIGRNVSAIAQYQKALAFTPDAPAVHRALAEVYWRKQAYPKAEPHYKAVLSHDANDVQAAYRLGLIFLSQGQYAAAVAQLERVLTLDLAHVRAYGALGFAQEKLGNVSEAIAAFEKVLQLDAENRHAMEMLKQLRE